MNSVSEKATEQSLRRRAKSVGLYLAKSRCRTPEVPHYGTYWLFDGFTKTVVYGDTRNGFGLSLSDVAECLNDYESRLALA